MVAFLVFLTMLSAAAAVAGDYPTPMDDDLSDRLRMSYWDYHRSQIRDDLDHNGRPLKVDVDKHRASCVDDDGRLKCECPLGDRGIL